MKAMILAAGLGTRLKPWTNEHPKALAPVNGKPLLQRNIEYLQQYGITDIVINIHHFYQQIINAVEQNKGWGSHISFSLEMPQELETGGGIKNAEKLLQDSDCFVVINVDILTDLDLDKMIARHKNGNAVATLATTSRNSTRHLLFNAAHHLVGWENTLTGERKISREAKEYLPASFSGVHVMSHAIFPLIRQQGRFSIIDTYLDLAQNQTIQSFDHTGGKFIDVGKPENIAKAEALFA